MKKILSVVFCAALVSTGVIAGGHLSKASKAPVDRMVNCSSTDGKVNVSLNLDQRTALVTKTDVNLPSYAYTNCEVSGSEEFLAKCTEGGNGRVLLVYNNYSGKYIGSRETHELTCSGN
ncbi:MAG: hypothetical protein HQK53_00340 [Oligoflexia bacterium]|nr:hypothetical protein [Oligoflexia bacterium]